MDWGDTDWQLAVLSAPIAPAGGRIDKVAARARCALSQRLWSGWSRTAFCVADGSGISNVIATRELGRSMVGEDI